MPSYIPKNKETVAVYFDREYPNGRITQDPLPIFGIVKNRERGTTKFNDGETINVNYREKGLNWINESELKKIAAKSLVKISKTRATGKKKLKKKKSIRRKKKQTGGRKNKKKSCGCKLSFPNLFGFLKKTKKRKQKGGS